MLWHRYDLGESRVIYVTGDIHDEMDRFQDSKLRRLRKNDVLIVCGDFGFIWDGGKREEKNLKKIGSRKYKVLFIDGTHENFDLLNRYPLEEWHGGKVHHICGNLYHLMRGQVYEIDDKRIFTFGGGESSDKEMRITARRWWPCELPNELEMREGMENLRAYDYKVDYIFTHEPPPNLYSVHGKPQEENRNRLDTYLGWLMKQVDYKKWFFGSRHIDRRITRKDYYVFDDIIPVEDFSKPHHLI